MVSKDVDPVGRLFARLTGEFEDAAGLATRGQNRTLSIVSRSDIARRLRRRIDRAIAVLDQIDRTLSPGSGR